LASGGEDFTGKAIALTCSSWPADLRPERQLLARRALVRAVVRRDRELVQRVVDPACRMVRGAHAWSVERSGARECEGVGAGDPPGGIRDLDCSMYYSSQSISTCSPRPRARRR
jgi:hypothetical protein